MSMKAIQCPSCGASLSVEIGKAKQCEYCGTYVDASSHDDKNPKEIAKYSSSGALNTMNSPRTKYYEDELQERLDRLEELEFDLEMARDELDDALMNLEFRDLI